MAEEDQQAQDPDEILHAAREDIFAAASGISRKTDDHDDNTQNISTV